MEWLAELVRADSPAQAITQAVLVIGVVAACGIALGSISVRGVGLGVAGVLFAGLIIGHVLGTREIHVDEQILDFARDFGLILFVYTIGVQVGPGFLASLRREGLPLNLMAAGIVILGAVMTVCIWRFGMDTGAGGDDRGELPIAVGLFCGATTNTPSLGAAQQVLREQAGAEAARLPGLGYAVAYPFGVIGIILTMIAVRIAFRIDPQAEANALAAMQEKATPLETMNLEVRNPNLAGLRLSEVPVLADSGLVVSRVMHGGRAEVARPETIISVGDVLLAVGPRPRLEQLKIVVGAESTTDVKAAPSNIVTRRVLVTRSDALGASLAELHLRERLGVTVTRIKRGEVEIAPTSAVRLQFGDALTVVGEERAIDEAAALLGNSLKRLNHPQVIAIFVGIVLGVIVGSWPIPVPGMPAPVKLGLAAGPLLVAIVLSRIRHIGPIVWHLPDSASFILRELGIVLFLAVVGLNNGPQFFAAFAHGEGWLWLGYGALITLAPLAIVAAVARMIYKLNYLTLCGLLAGSMTDPPALAFAGTLTSSEAPSISYAMVYPMVMVLRVLAAQAMVLLLYH